MSASKRQGMGRDELEVHEVLSPVSGSSQAASGSTQGRISRRSHGSATGPLPEYSAGTPARSGPNVLNLGDFASVIRDTVLSEVKAGLSGIMEGLAVSNSGGIKRKRPEHVHAISEDDDLPSVGMDSVHEDTGYPDGVFGSDVNAEPDDLVREVLEDEVEPDHSFAPARNPSQPAASASVPSVPSPVEPDEDLPDVSPRLPST